jgi:hypothetical protein
MIELLIALIIGVVAKCIVDATDITPELDRLELLLTSRRTA